MAKYAKLVKRLVPRDRVKKLCQLFWQLVAKKFSTVDGEKFIFIIGRDRCVCVCRVCACVYCWHSSRRESEESYNYSSSIYIYSPACLPACLCVPFGIFYLILVLFRDVVGCIPPYNTPLNLFSDAAVSENRILPSSHPSAISSESNETEGKITRPSTATTRQNTTTYGLSILGTVAKGRTEIIHQYHL